MKLYASFFKRILDIVISLAAIVILSPLIIGVFIVLLVIYKSSPLFFQARPGKNEKKIRIIKFKSMNDKKDENGNLLSDAQRLTKAGRFCRKYSLDELPQLINVLKGDMSLVGPRPHMLKHTTDYSKVVDDYMIRQFLKPGITGWAQINGYRGEITNPEQIKMRVNKDLWYLENWSLWLDIQILFLTIYHVFKGNKEVF